MLLAWIAGYFLAKLFLSPLFAQYGTEDIAITLFVLFFLAAGLQLFLHYRKRGR